MLGAWVSLRAAQQGYRVDCVRLSDSRAAGGPRADTLRNQGWLQSGLRYARMDRDFLLQQARRMWTTGSEMLNALHIERDTRGGVWRVSEERAKDISEAGEEMCIPEGQRRVLGATEAEVLLGPLYREGGVYMKTPETTFPEEEIVTEVRARARARGVEFQEAERPVELEVIEGQVIARMDELAIEAKVVVLAAGGGLARLLSQVGVCDYLEFRRTPLLVHEQAIEDCQVAVFQDNVSGRKYSLTNHQPKSEMSKGAVVVGTDFSNRSADLDPWAREISRDDWEQVLAGTPDFLREGRCTTGFETFPARFSKQEEWLPDIWVPEDLKNVIVAIPGRATMAMTVADEVVERITKIFPIEGQFVDWESEINVGKNWGEPIHMHFQQHYSGHLHNVAEENKDG